MVPPTAIAPILINFLHNVFTALWIGGMLTLAITILPAIRKVLGKSKESKDLNSVIKKKLSLLIYISIIGLIITGLLMSNRAVLSGLSTGFLSFGNEYSILMSIKHILYFLMIFLSLFRSQIVDKVKKFTPKQKQMLNMLTLIFNILAGLGVLFLSSYVSVIAGLP
jgi:putative copper export protein